MGGRVGGWGGGGLTGMAAEQGVTDADAATGMTRRGVGWGAGRGVWISGWVGMQQDTPVPVHQCQCQMRGPGAMVLVGWGRGQGKGPKGWRMGEAISPPGGASIHE